MLGVAAATRCVKNASPSDPLNPWPGTPESPGVKQDDWPGFGAQTSKRTSGLAVRGVVGGIPVEGIITTATGEGLPNVLSLVLTSFVPVTGTMASLTVMSPLSAARTNAPPYG